MGRYDVSDGNILIIGDLHFSDIFKGKHLDYKKNCIDVMNQLDELIEKEKPKAIVLLGDIVGWNERNLQKRENLTILCKYLMKWRSYGPLFSVRGNHDSSKTGYPDFMFFVELNILVSSADCNGYFDFYAHNGDEIPSVRFHLVDWGDESRALNLASEPTANIVLGHNNFTVAGLTTWYSGGDGIELSTLENFQDVKMVISGHIHNPSPDFVEATMLNGNNCTLYYPGCPMRPIREKSGLYDTAHIVKVIYNPSIEKSEIDVIDLKLKPYDEVFDLSDNYLDEKTQEELDEEMRKEALSDVLGDLLKYRMNQTDPISQIENIPNTSDEVKQLAISYLRVAMEGKIVS